ncbi:hypothetical protein CPB86DRAFT_695243 [Serendipita vermifera]|nr:hypothetical protein CPB86DRAFT_695243 [Serendipita vermifera]
MKTATKLSVRHSTWYLEDGNCIFRVESTLFNLHRFLLTRHSAVFRTLFELPPPSALSPEGRVQYNNEMVLEGVADSHPITLNGVTVAAFEPFLTLLYLPDEAFTLAEWTSILDLATRWDFTTIRRYAIAQLECFSDDTLTPALRVSLANRFSITGAAWSLQPLAKLVSREEPLTIEDAQLLGLELTILVARAREEVRATFEVDEEWCNTCEQCPKSSLLEEDRVGEVFNRVFRSSTVGSPK